MCRVADTKGGPRGRVFYGFNKSCRRYQGRSKGERVLLRIFCIVSRIPMVFDGWRGIVKGILYRVAYTMGVLREERFVKGIMYSVADTKGGLRVGGFLRVYCIVSRTTRVF